MYEKEENNDVPKDEFWDAQQLWCQELIAARDEWEDFHQRGDKIIEFYVDDRKSRRTKRFPLFNANVSILENALFARIPRPDVNRRFKDPDDQVGRVASLILQRALITELEANSNFKTATKSMIKDMLVSGMGIGWVRYEAEVEDVQISDDEDAELSEHPDASPILKDQQTPIDYVHWKDFRMSPCRTFNECRWVARRVYMDESECKSRFGDRAEFLNYTERPFDDENSDGRNEPQNFIEPQASIWEIWDKTTKKVYFICETSPTALDIQDDPLGLPDFFPTDKPLTANIHTSKFLPIADYTVLQDQYNDLNEVNNRISRLVRAARLAGVYDESQAAVKLVLDGAAETQLIPVKDFAGFSEKGGLRGAIDWMPLEQVNATINALSLRQEALKQQIYELTGISDIIRGATSPYETAAAQGMKMQSASIRLQGKQTDVAEYLSSLIIRKAHLMLKFYTPERLLERCGTLAQADQQLVPAAIQLLQNELLTSLKLDISTDSLQQPNWARDQQERTQLITAFGSLIGQALPAAKEFPAIAPLLGHMVKLGVAGLPAGREIEGELEMALQSLRQQSQQSQSQPSQEEQQAQQAAQQAQQKMQFEMQMAQEELQMKKEQAAAELQLKREQMMGELQLKREVEMMKASQKPVPQFVQGDMGMDEDALAQALAQSAHVTAQAIAESAQNTVAAITALANQPQEPIRMRLTRNAEGGLDGVAI